MKKSNFIYEQILQYLLFTTELFALQFVPIQCLEVKKILNREFPFSALVIWHSIFSSQNVQAIISETTTLAQILNWQFCWINFDEMLRKLLENALIDPNSSRCVAVAIG